MATRVGINGFGRIGRAFTRLAAEGTDLDVVAVNDITDARTLAFDSAYGRFGQRVTADDHALIIGGRPISVLAERNPSAIDWGGLGVDLVVECTGRFRSRDAVAPHLKRGRYLFPPQKRALNGLLQ